MNKKAYLLINIEEYGKFIAYCIENDISVFRTYWNEREKGDRCYSIDWQQKRCYYSSRKYWESEGYEIIIPNLYADKYGNYKIDNTITPQNDKYATTNKSEWIHLPCKVGDVVYQVTRNFISEFRVRFVEIATCGNLFLHTDLISGIVYTGEVFSESDIGKTVFLAREDAEKALKDMRKEDEGK